MLGVVLPVRISRLDRDNQCHTVNMFAKLCRKVHCRRISQSFDNCVRQLFGSCEAVPTLAGPVWDPQQVVLVSPSGKLPSVPSRGDSLNGTAYASLGTIGRHSSGNGSSPTASNDGAGSSNSTSGSGGSTSSATRGVSVTHTPDPPWLQCANSSHINRTCTSAHVGCCSLGPVFLPGSVCSDGSEALDLQAPACPESVLVPD